MNVCFVLLRRVITIILQAQSSSWHVSKHRYSQLSEYSTKVLARNYGPDAVACGDRLNQTVSHQVK